MVFIYKLYCDDTVRLIQGDHEINLADEVKKALHSMSYEAVVEPHDDWFEAIIDIVCENTGFQCVQEYDSHYVEDDYWAEVRRREEQDMADDEYNRENRDEKDE